MSGPWYQTQGPTTQEIKDILFKIFTKDKNNLVSINEINKILDEIIKKNEGAGWGSYRGYYTFVHSDLVNEIKEKIIKVKKQKAIKIICKFIENSQWLQHRMYKPNGWRYNEIKENFEKLKEN